jgi:hypothetical protein
MPPVRRSNRALKPRVFLDPYITPLSRRQPPTFTIYLDALEAPPEAPSEAPLQALPEAYQPQFLPENRAGKPQNMPQDTSPIKLFQLFFPVKEIANIVKNSNS